MADTQEYTFQAEIKQLLHILSQSLLQDNTIFRKIRRVLVKRVLDHLDKLANDEAQTYRTSVVNG